MRAFQALEGEIDAVQLTAAPSNSWGGSSKGRKDASPPVLSATFQAVRLLVRLLIEERKQQRARAESISLTPKNNNDRRCWTGAGSAPRGTR